MMGAPGEDDSIHVAKKKAAEDLANKMQEKQKKKEADEQLGQEYPQYIRIHECINMISEYIYIYMMLLADICILFIELAGVF